MSNWQTVFKDQQEHRAGIVWDRLMNHKIRAIMVNKKDSLYGLGYCEIQVATDDVTAAIKIIQEDISFE